MTDKTSYIVCCAKIKPRENTLILKIIKNLRWQQQSIKATEEPGALLRERVPVWLPEPWRQSWDMDLGSLSPEPGSLSAKQSFLPTLDKGQKSLSGLALASNFIPLVWPEAPIWLRVILCCPLVGSGHIAAPASGGARAPTPDQDSQRSAQ